MKGKTYTSPFFIKPRLGVVLMTLIAVGTMAFRAPETNVYAAASPNSKAPYTAEVFLGLFPKMTPDGLHVYYDIYDVQEGKPNPNSRFCGQALAVRRCKILADYDESCRYYYMDTSSSGYDEDYGLFFAVGRFDIDKDHQGLITRVPAEYESSMIKLFVWDNKAKRVCGHLELSNYSGDAGEFWETQSWLSMKKGRLEVMTHDIWLHEDIDIYFDTLNALIENNDSSHYPPIYVTEFVSQVWASRWEKGRFVTDTILNPQREEGYQLIDRWSDEMLLWAKRYSHKADTFGMIQYAWVDMAGEYEPRFEGGEAALHEWISRGLQLPDNASGEVWVIVRIGYDGLVKSTLLLKDAYGIGQQVCALMQKSPRWTPAKVNWKNYGGADQEKYKNAPIESQYILKLNFKKGRL